MIMKGIVNVLLFLLSQSVSAIPLIRQYSLEGNLPASVNGTKIYLMLNGTGNRAPVDSMVVVNGAFRFVGNTGHMDVATVYSNEKGKIVQAVVGEGPVKVTCRGDRLRIAGGHNNQLLQAYRDSLDVLDDLRSQIQLDALLAEYRRQDISDERRVQIMRIYNDFRKRRVALTKTLIEQNIDNIVGAYIFSNSYNLYKENMREALIEKAGRDFQEYPPVQRIKRKLESTKKRRAGNRYIDFAMPDVQGRGHRLSEFFGPGKYILLDFWASWCGPCRAEMPHLKSVYERFHPKGLEVIGISLDNKKEAWTEAIRKLDLPWIQLSDLQGWKNAAARQYGVTGIPCTVLIGPDGVIVGSDLRSIELSRKLETLFKGR